MQRIHPILKCINCFLWLHHSCIITHDTLLVSWAEMFLFIYSPGTTYWDLCLWRKEKNTRPRWSVWDVLFQTSENCVLLLFVSSSLNAVEELASVYRHIQSVRDCCVKSWVLAAPPYFTTRERHKATWSRGPFCIRCSTTANYIFLIILVPPPFVLNTF